jgi:peptidoglycan/LPS O-acetylase OafA/YrhL
MGLIRLFLALAVVQEHVGLKGASFQLLNGRLAVESFYIISGFYMALVLDRKYSTSTLVFLFNRVVRLYPAYLALTLLALLTSLSGAEILGLRNHFAQALLLVWPHLGFWGRLYAVGSNLLMEGKDLLLFLTVDPNSGLYHLGLDKDFVPANSFQLLPQAWSLGLEFNFYLLSAWLVRLRTPWILGIIGITYVAKVLMSFHGIYVSPWDYRFFPAELGIFLVGSLAYRVYQGLNGPKDPWRRVAQCAALGWLACVVCHQSLPDWLGEVWAVLLTLTLLGLALPWIFEQSKYLSWDRLVGELSYGVYLGHLILIDLLSLAFERMGIPPGGLYQASVAAASIALAWLIKRHIERPADAWRRRLSERWLAEGTRRGR